MEVYLSLAVSIVAVAISLISLSRTRKKDEREKRFALIDLKSEVRLAESKLNSMLGELSALYLNQFFLLTKIDNPTNLQLKELDRVKSNIKLINEKRSSADNEMLRLMEVAPESYEHWQDMKVTFLSWAGQIESELSKEERHTSEFLKKT